jgi:hypothetical protein
MDAIYIWIVIRLSLALANSPKGLAILNLFLTWTRLPGYSLAWTVGMGCGLVIYWKYFHRRAASTSAFDKKEHEV